MKRFARSICALALFFTFASPSFAQEAAVIATVNDHPVTSFDVDQRIRLMKLLGENNPAKLGRVQVANSLINDVVKIDEAKRGHIEPTEKDIDQRLIQMATGMKTDQAGLKSRLASQGLTVGTLRQYAAAQMSFARLLSAKFHEKVDVDQASVDKKYAAIKADIDGKVRKVEADPRRQPVKVIQLQEVNFPVEGNDPQLLQSRAVEAGQVGQKIKSCSGIRGAASGVFNVQVGKMIEADSRRLPPPLLAQINARGVGRAVGPMRYKGGIQLLAFCGSRMIVPPKLNVQYPTRQQIENMTLNEKYDAIEAKYVAKMRQTAIIEYKDQSYAQ
jgi:peptidyl-prolyl cis-trans isomerase SurA